MSLTKIINGKQYTSVADTEKRATHLKDKQFEKIKRTAFKLQYK